MNKKIRAIAYYLPQFHPTVQNNEWWGEGFTEWTNVTKAKPLFRGHEQPFLPSDLGFYDLRVPETREEQAKLALEHGIEGFCYWHYWFGNGLRVLERPFNEVLESGKPDFPFCLGWANETWTGKWTGSPNKLLAVQTYPGEEDYINHFYNVLAAFKDPRYIKVNNKPLFVVYRPFYLPDVVEFTSLWRSLALKEGLEGIHFVAVNERTDPEAFGFDAVVPNSPLLSKRRTTIIGKIYKRFLEKNFQRIKYLRHKLPEIYTYKNYIEKNNNHQLNKNEYPNVIPGWDNTPRSGLSAAVLLNSTPELFGEHLGKVISQVEHKLYEDRIVFVKSWNEWAEGNTLEPSRKFGKRFLEVFKDAVVIKS